MKEKVYVETSVIGAYFDERTDVASAAQKYWTRIWWDDLSNQYEIMTSQAVVNELSHPDYPYSTNCLELIENIEKFPLMPEIKQIVKIYIENRVMPQNPTGDALHLALASFYKCDYLLTWNCKHIANPKKFKHIQVVNVMMGLYTPILCTPNQLIGGND